MLGAVLAAVSFVRVCHIMDIVKKEKNWSIFSFGDKTLSVPLYELGAWGATLDYFIPNGPYDYPLLSMLGEGHSPAYLRPPSNSVRNFSSCEHCRFGLFTATCPMHRSVPVACPQPPHHFPHPRLTSDTSVTCSEPIGRDQ